MDQEKIGAFLKELRKEKGLTQEQLAEQLSVTGRTVSRWETGSNLPDISLLVELADFYAVDIKEIIQGERKSGNMNTEEKESIKMVADYAEADKQKTLKRVRILLIMGLISMAAAVIISCTGANKTSNFFNALDGCFYGFAFGVMVMNLLYTTGVLEKIRSNPKVKLIAKIVGIVGGLIVIASLVLAIVLK